MFYFKLTETLQCVCVSAIKICAVTCDFQQCGILTSVISDEPGSLLLSLETSNGVQSVA